MTPDKNKRFFMVSYSAATENGFSNGNHFVQTSDGGFINNNGIKDYLEGSIDYLKKGTVVISNIIEFQSESDFKEFIRP